MAIRSTIIALGLLVAGLFSTTSSFANDPCLDGTAPKGWLRPGGYCDVSHSLNPFGSFFRGHGGSYGGPTLVGHRVDGAYETWAYSDGTIVQSVGGTTYYMHTVPIPGPGGHANLVVDRVESGGFHF